MGPCRRLLARALRLDSRWSRTEPGARCAQPLKSRPGCPLITSPKDGVMAPEGQLTFIYIFTKGEGWRRGEQARGQGLKNNAQSTTRETAEALRFSPGTTSAESAVSPRAREGARVSSERLPLLRAPSSFSSSRTAVWPGPSLPRAPAGRGGQDLPLELVLAGQRAHFLPIPAPPAPHRSAGV